MSPLFDLPVLVEQAGGHGLLGGDVAGLDRQGDDQRAADRGEQRDRGQAAVVQRLDGGAQGLERGRVLGHMGYVVGHCQASAVGLGGPIQQRLPEPRLALHQWRRRVRVVT